MKHLDWPEDDRICHMEDSDGPCPGCCHAKSPIEEFDMYWECIWKHGHDSSHMDIWCNEWE